MKTELAIVLVHPGPVGLRAFLGGVDVAVDFSQPKAVLPNIEACSRIQLSIVVGTTGWGAERSRAEQLVRELYAEENSGKPEPSGSRIPCEPYTRLAAHSPFHRSLFS